MKYFYFLFNILLLLISPDLFSQKAGDIFSWKTYESHFYTGEGKLISWSITSIMKKTIIDNNAEMRIRKETFNKDSTVNSTSEFFVKYEDSVFYFGRTRIIQKQTTGEKEKTEEQLGGDTYYLKYEDGEYFMDTTIIVPEKKSNQNKDTIMRSEEYKYLKFPFKPTVGMFLEDLDFSYEYPSVAINISVTNRKVEAIEECKTPQGVFKCYRISQQVESTSTVAGVENPPNKRTSIDWFAPGVSLVIKTETYQDDKLKVYYVLSALKR